MSRALTVLSAAVVAIALASVVFAGLRHRQWLVVEHPDPEPGTGTAPESVLKAKAACPPYHWDNANQRCLPNSTPEPWLTLRPTCSKFWVEARHRCLPVSDFLQQLCRARDGRPDVICQTPTEFSYSACNARGGLDDGGLGCIEPTEQAECAAMGGRWEGGYPMECIGKPQQAACENHGGRWHVGRLGSACYEAAQISACSARGGTLERVGMGGMLDCIVVAADGGKECTDGRQCRLARCLYQGDNLAMPSNSGLVGQCARDNNSFGCFMLLKQGRLSESYCVD